MALFEGRVVDLHALASSDELRSLWGSMSGFSLLIAWSVSNDLSGDSEDAVGAVSVLVTARESLFFDKNPTANRLFLGRIGGCIIPGVSSEERDPSFPIEATRYEESS